MSESRLFHPSNNPVAGRNNSKDYKVISVDIGGTNTRVALHKTDGDPEYNHGEYLAGLASFSTDDDLRVTFDKIATHMGAQLDGDKPDAIGIGMAGRLNSTGDKMVSAGKLSSWVGIDIKQAFARAYSEKSKERSSEALEPKIKVINDAVAAAYSELNYRKLKKDESGLFIAWSTGLGGAAYLDGKIVAYEPGHQHFQKEGVAKEAKCSCGQGDHLEAYIGGAGIEKKYGRPGQEIEHRSKEWEEIEQDFCEGMIQTLVRYENDLTRLPKIISITGAVAERGPYMLGSLQNRLYKEYGKSAPVIRFAIQGEESGLYGAAHAARALLLGKQLVIMDNA